MLAAATEYTKKHQPQLTAFQQDLPASESFRECISNTLTALKKLKLNLLIGYYQTLALQQLTYIIKVFPRHVVW